MRILKLENSPTPEALAGHFEAGQGLVLLRSGRADMRHGRYSLLAARPFLVFRSRGSLCEIIDPVSGSRRTLFGNPWELLDAWIARYELRDEIDLPFPLGGAFGFWGYDLKNFVEPKLRRRALTDLELPDCHVGLYSNVVVFDHQLDCAWVVATGLRPDGTRSEPDAEKDLRFWAGKLAVSRDAKSSAGVCNGRAERGLAEAPHRSSLTQDEFLRRVCRAQEYIRQGDIYQVNLAQRLTVEPAAEAWELFLRLSEASPAPFSAYLDCGEFQLVSSSPEQFLKLSGSMVQTRPIKGTRPRSMDPTRDAQLMYELQTSPKEISELVMITDLLRNDLGRVCEFGSVQVPELVRLERYSHVQHLVSTVEGRLRPEVTHFAALASCFPGGSITGAPKFRAMEIIDELEPVARGPYTGALGYLGFNRESQFSIIIRTAVCMPQEVHFYAGAGIVADSVPKAEYEETLAKAAGFAAAISKVRANVAAPGRNQG